MNHYALKHSCEHQPSSQHAPEYETHWFWRAAREQMSCAAYSLNTSKPPLAWESTFSYSEGVNKKGTFTSPHCLIPPNLVTLLQDGRLGTHNCTGHWRSEDSSGRDCYSERGIICCRSSGLLRHSRCIIAPNQALLQSALPSGRIWLLRCLRGLLQGSLDIGGGGEGDEVNAEDLDDMRSGLLISSTWAWIWWHRGELGGGGPLWFHTEMAAES